MVKVEGLSKVFRLYRKPSDRLREILFKKPYHTDYQALKDVSFDVPDGKTLGIIGQNGAGKSTLLKILTGVLLPDSGKFEIDGKITGLLELGTGFNIDLSGRENIYLNGMLLGMPRNEIDRKYRDITSFSELGDFINEPMRTYSSGMTMRLAFSIAIHAEPRCFVIDEALSVGDAHFQQKCLNRIGDFRQNGGSIIFISHDMSAIKVLCDKVLLIDRGAVVEEGPAEKVVNIYNYLIARMNDQENQLTFTDGNKQNYGTQAAIVLDVSIIGQDSKSNMISAGEVADIHVTLQAQQEIDDLTVGVLIRDRYGQDIFGVNNHHIKYPIYIHAGQTRIVTYTLPVSIGLGKYTISAALHSGSSHVTDCYHWCDHIATFEVTGYGGNIFAGLCKLYPTITTDIV